MATSSINARSTSIEVTGGGSEACPLHYPSMKTLIIGLGNPILTDDGAGIYAARMVERVLPKNAEVDIVELAVGGLELMETMIGYERVIIIDALWAPNGESGQVVRFNAGDLPDTMNSASAHDADLPLALCVGREIGVALPVDENIQIVGIRARKVLDFGKEPTPPVSAALPEAVNMVLDLLGYDPVIDPFTLSPADCWRL
ncbi:MAG: hydrogenase maturation protease [Anaerolineae bacterium]|nr:hydrogenase maturation protease [Anaerolineae bacterium]